MKPRIAVLGCGYWGSKHIRTLKALGALHAVSDANRARAEGFASEQDCRAHGAPADHPDPAASLQIALRTFDILISQ